LTEAYSQGRARHIRGIADFDPDQRMRQLVHGNRRARRAVVIEEFRVNRVTAAEIGHVDEVGRQLHDIAEARATVGKNPGDDYQHRAGLRADIEARDADCVDLGGGDSILGAAGTVT
jgi:hypothetical protein